MSSARGLPFAGLERRFGSVVSYGGLCVAYSTRGRPSVLSSVAELLILPSSFHSDRAKTRRFAKCKLTSSTFWPRPPWPSTRFVYARFYCAIPLCKALSHFIYKKSSLSHCCGHVEDDDAHTKLCLCAMSNVVYAAKASKSFVKF